MSMSKTVDLAAVAFGLVAIFAAGGVNAAEETTGDILAVRARDQGFACDKAKSVQKDAKQSAPNETVWILNCENDAYRMTLVPDMADKIERLKK